MAAHVIDGMATGSTEVKTDRRFVETGNVFIEYECRKRGRYEPSGIFTTNAEWWFFYLAPLPGGFTVSTWALADMVRKEIAAGRTVECRDGSNPTHGVVLQPARILYLLRRAA